MTAPEPVYVNGKPYKLPTGFKWQRIRLIRCLDDCVIGETCSVEIKSPRQMVMAKKLKFGLGETPRETIVLKINPFFKFGEYHAQNNY